MAPDVHTSITRLLSALTTHGINTHCVHSSFLVIVVTNSSTVCLLQLERLARRTSTEWCTPITNVRSWRRSFSTTATSPWGGKVSCRCRWTSLRDRWENWTEASWGQMGQCLSVQKVSLTYLITAPTTGCRNPSLKLERVSSVCVCVRLQSLTPYCCWDSNNISVRCSQLVFLRDQFIQKITAKIGTRTFLISRTFSGWEMFTLCSLA